LKIGFNELGVPMKRAVLYRNFHEISSLVYLVEVSRDIKKVFILLFPNFEQPTSFIGEVLQEKVALKLVSDNNNSFECFIGKFQVKYGKLQISGYHFNKNHHVPSSRSLKHLPLDQ
jgi:hypothetical protein